MGHHTCTMILARAVIVEVLDTNSDTVRSRTVSPPVHGTSIVNNLGHGIGKLNKHRHQTAESVLE